VGGSNPLGGTLCDVARCGALVARRAALSASYRDAPEHCAGPVAAASSRRVLSASCRGSDERESGDVAAETLAGDVVQPGVDPGVDPTEAGVDGDVLES